MRLVTAVALIALLAGCGTSIEVETVRVATTPAPPATPAASAPASAAEPAEEITSGEAAVDAEPALEANDPYPDLAPGEKQKLWGEMYLEMDLEPTCATVGTQMKAVIRTVPDALVGGAVRYADNDPHEDLTFGRAPTGEHVWTWVIKPTVPKGTAEAMVTAGKRGETGGAVMAAFEVADAC